MEKRIKGRRQDTPSDTTRQTGEVTDSAVSDILESLNPEQRAVMIESMRAIRQESFSGPIPHPDLLRGYEGVQSGLAERIVKMAEREQEHRFDCELRMIKGSVSGTRRGQWIGFAVSVLFLLAASVLGYLGHDWLGGVLGGGTLLGLVTVFLTNKPGPSRGAGTHIREE